MKRQWLLRHLRDNHCLIVKEGGEHTWVQNQFTGRKSFVPRHREIKPAVLRVICRQLGIPIPREK
jgi:mRNA interferase HicA